MGGVILAPASMQAQRIDGYFNDNFDNYNNRTVDPISIWAATNGIQNDNFGNSPLGSGLFILSVAGVGYAISRRRRNIKKGTTFLLAALMLLGLTNCRKKIVEPIIPSSGKQVAITLSVGDAKAVVTPPSVAFEKDDQIIVVSSGQYVGTLTHNGTNFSGNITNPTVDEPLYFYFLGNRQGSLEVGDDGCYVSISDQTDYPHLPVISMGVSIDRLHGNAVVNYTTDNHEYEAQLHNKCALMKFSVTTGANSPISVTGMKNLVIIDFSNAANDGANNGFSYYKMGEDGIKLKGGKGNNVEKWAIVLPQSELAAGSAGSIYAQNGDYTTFTGSRPTIHAIEANGYYHEGADVISMTVNTATNYVDLGDVTSNTTITNGKTVFGTLASNVKVSIADGATVTLHNVNINGNGLLSNYCAGITCDGNATINLSGTNIVRGLNNDYPGIQAPDSEPDPGIEKLGAKTLTIQGTGSLTATSNGNGAGIGGYEGGGCGNISIMGGTVTAISNGAGAGIGSGLVGDCGDITISSGITCVRAIKSNDNAYSIGGGQGGGCGTVTFGGVSVDIYNVSSGNYGEVTLSISTTTNTDDTWTLKPIYLFSVSSTKKVLFSPGNLQYKSGEGWRFAEHQYDICQTSMGDWQISGWVDLFGWGTWSGNQYHWNPLNTSYEHAEYTWEGNVFFQGEITNNDESGWFTLTKDEWSYLFAHNTYGWTAVDGHYGYVIRPDGVNDAVKSSYDDDEWDVEEDKGSVFLPAAGYRLGNNVGHTNYQGYYYSSTPEGEEQAWYANIKESVLVIEPDDVDYAYSVRLVRVVE